MKITIMICSGAADVIWNAFRLANMMLENMEDVCIFLNGPSVKYQELDSATFPLKELAKVFTLSEGRLLACGKLLDLHDVKDGCHARGTQKDLYELIQKSDKVVSF